MTPAQQLVLSSASPVEIINALSRASANFSTNRLLPIANRFQTEISTKVDKICRGRGPYTEPELVESVAISSILHLFDGWSYFSESLKATFRSEHAIARHLAYYGELRAAMSILAAHGIGVFNRNHLVIDNVGSIHKYPGNAANKTPGTHIMAWEALKFWGVSAYSGQLIGDDIFAFGVPLNDWLKAFQSTTTFNFSGAEWVEKWGLDLSRLTSDRETRNEVSYNVCFDHTLPRHIPETLEPWLKEIWLASEPSASPFSTLDQYLIRSTLEGVFNAKFKTPGTSTAQSQAQLTARIRAACLSLGVSQFAVDFMTRTSNSSDLQFMQFAAKRSKVNDPMQFQEVLSRTFLLLRLASAAVRTLMQSAGLSADDLAFWWKRVFGEAGVWEKNSPPADFEEAKDLWADTQSSLDELSDFIASNPGSCWFNLNSNLASDIENLSRAEKVALWGLS